MARIRTIKPVFWKDIKSSKIESPCFIYVISENKNRLIAPCKIGIATHLEKRLSSLQGGNFRELYLHTKIFVCARSDAKEAEQYCLRVTQSKRLMSEWVNLSPDDITSRLIEFINCDYLRIFEQDQKNG